MSVLIKGMEMPPNCCECPINLYLCKYGYKYLIQHRELYDKRADDCPLVEIPPHGRLIDADALMHDTDSIVHKTMLFGGQYVYSEDAIKNASTIIDAEENE